MATRMARAVRLVERAVLGMVMGAVAFVIERRVLRAIKRDASASAPKRGLRAVGGAQGLAVTPNQVEE